GPDYRDAHAIARLPQAVSTGFDLAERRFLGTGQVVEVANEGRERRHIGVDRLCAEDERHMTAMDLRHVHTTDRPDDVALGPQTGQDAHHVAALLQLHVINTDVRGHLEARADGEVDVRVILGNLDDRLLELETMPHDEIVALLGIVDERRLDVYRVVDLDRQRVVEVTSDV